MHGIWRTPATNFGVEGVTTDTRTARSGDLYVALSGEKFDGHSFLPEADKAGCIAAIVRRDFPLDAGLSRLFGGGIIGVQDTRVALGELAAHYRRLVPAAVVAVTGSNGKTTTKRMIHHILAKRHAGTCSPKSFNNNVGVPLTLLGVSPSDDYVVCEVGSNAPGEIAALTRIAQPDIAVITSVGPTHLEKLIDVAHVAVEKAAILTKLSAGGLAVVWSDSPELDRALRAYDCRQIRFGRSDDAELRLTGYIVQGEAQRFQINDRLWVRLPAFGRHMACNALAAIAVAQRFGFEQEEAAEALADFGGTEMRLQEVRCGSVRVLNDAYNANPASVAAAAAVLADVTTTRRVMILGDMRELGSAGEDLHRQLGLQLAGVTDLLIGIGPLGRLLAEAAAQAGAATAAFDSTEAAAPAVPDLLRDGDVVLIKGSRAMGMERLVGPIAAAFGSRLAEEDKPARKSRPRKGKAAKKAKAPKSKGRQD